jgi:hypothetical protein
VRISAKVCVYIFKYMLVAVVSLGSRTFLYVTVQERIKLLGDNDVHKNWAAHNIMIRLLVLCVGGSHSTLSQVHPLLHHMHERHPCSEIVVTVVHSHSGI